MTEDQPAGEGALGALFGEFLGSRTTRKMSPHTIAAYRRDLLEIARLVRLPGEPPHGDGDAGGEAPAVARMVPADLTARAMRGAFAVFAGPRSAASVCRAWSTWNQFFNFLVADGVVGGNPMPAVDRPRAPRRSPKPLQGETTPEALLEAIADDERTSAAAWPERDLAVIVVALCAGLRSAEILGLTVASVAGRAGERRVHVVGKGGKPRTVPIEPELDAVLRAYLDSRRARFGGHSVRPDTPLFVDRHGEPLQRGGLQYLVRSAYRRAGVSDRVPRGALVHALRHTFATRLAEDGASASEIMRLLGHASLTTSQNYIDATAREQRMAIKASRTNRALRQIVG
jgi:integrase/recombinase XerC